jgi:mRNA-degrading endonuclease RelE of RelBE toxin-antitoxin system
MYPKIELRQYDSSELRERIRVQISNLKPSSSPGYPYMLWAKTTSELISTMGETWLVDLVYYRIVLLMLTPAWRIRRLSAVERVEWGLVDPVRVFVKNELHSTKKVRQGRYRLIMSISVVDQLVDRVFSTEQNSEEIRHWKHIPSKPGMGLDDEGL